MFSDPFVLWNTPWPYVLAAVMTALFLLEFKFEKWFFTIANTALAVFAVLLCLLLRAPLGEVLLLLLIALLERLILTLWRKRS